jgi:2-hydroxy-6-oxonona-2,4-dienedioate hydrolase
MDVLADERLPASAVPCGSAAEPTSLAVVGRHGLADLEGPVSGNVATFRSVWTTIGHGAMHARASVGGVADTAPAVVLVPGLGLSGRYMLPTARVLSATHHVYVPDLPGFGDSDPPRRVLDVPGLADALGEWLLASGLDGAPLLGNSFACQILSALAVRRPGLTGPMILQGPTAPPEERSWLRQFVCWRRNSPYNPPSLGPITNADYRKAGYLRVLRTFRHSLRHGIENDMPNIEAPTLLVRGELDPICPQDWVERIASLGPRAELVVIPRAAHTLVYTSPRELAEVSLSFLHQSERLAIQMAGSG